MRSYTFPAGWRFLSNEPSKNFTDNTSELFGRFGKTEEQKPYAKLAPNQELIGVYGKHDGRYITQLGFIVKEEVFE